MCDANAYCGREEYCFKSHLSVLISTSNIKMCSKNAQCASSVDDEYNLHECVCKAGFLGDGLTCDTDYSKKKLN